LKIIPNINSKGINMFIPMISHKFNKETINNDIDIFINILNEHDIVYIVTDSRESRWLPIYLCKKYNKNYKGQIAIFIKFNLVHV
jgi:ubiquitin-like modifier-activating enzyme ATG7